MATIEGTNGKDRISTKTTVPGQPFATDLDDILNGYGSNDLLNGAGGADVMTGGGGNDRYYVDDAGDVVVEHANEGIDVVFTTLLSHTLGLNLEGLKFIGTGDFTGTGNGLANRLIGSSGSDVLDARDGNDLLDGGAGADVMVGGEGDDVYYVSEGGDVVIELLNEGTDTVIASADYALIPGQGIETLRVAGAAGLSLAGNERDNSLFGGAGDDTLNGGAGNDRLDGGAGADLMAGGVDDDIYYVDDASDIVFEEVGEGTDTVYARTDYELTAGYEVETLRALGLSGVSLTGNEFDNTLVGAAASDALDGGAGEDRLVGAGGDDILDGGTGADQLEGGAGNDTLIDCECDYNDILIGGNGSDFLFSGGGADVLSGNNGSDVFVYLSPGDSTHNRRDTIRDFAHGIDILDFSALEGGSSFHPLVTTSAPLTTIDAFTLLAFVSNRDTILFVNNTASAQAIDAASMEILLQGVQNLTDSDLGYYLI